MTSSQKAKSLAIITGSSVVALLPTVAHAETTQSAVDSVQPASAASGDLQSNIKNIINAMLLVIGIVAVIMLIVGGFRYVLSNGNEKAVTGAKDTILYAIIGIVVALLSFAIVNFVLGQFT